MHDSQTVAAYLETVAEQIRWKRARPVLVRELEQHLTDQRDAFVKAGKPEDEAEQLAVEDMGDPVEVGAALDAVHRPRPQWGLLGLTIALAAVCTALRLVLTAVSMGNRCLWPCGPCCLEPGPWWDCTFWIFPGWPAMPWRSTSGRWSWESGASFSICRASARG